MCDLTDEIKELDLDNKERNKIMATLCRIQEDRLLNELFESKDIEKVKRLAIDMKHKAYCRGWNDRP